MPDWLLKVLGQVYQRIPAGLRPHVKRLYEWFSVRAQALVGRRVVGRAQRVTFLDFEIAHLEPCEFLGPGRGEVMVGSEFSLVSPGTERAVLCGLPGARRRFPYAPGYSAVGLVERVGEGMVGFKPGDRVAGRMAHATSGIMSTASLFRVPDGLPPEAACFIELGIICMQGVRKARIRPGDRVAVVGQGLIGQLAVRLARLAGASYIWAVAKTRRRAAPILGEGGADAFISLSEEPDALDHLGADIAIEAVGTSPAILLAMQATRDGGRVSLLGSSRDLGRDVDWLSLAQKRNLTLVGAHIGALPRVDPSAAHRTYQQEGELFLQLLASRRLRVDDLVTWRAKPRDCNSVYEVVAHGGGHNVAIVFDWATTGSVL